MELKVNKSLLTLLLIIFVSFTLTTSVFRTRPISDFLYYWILAHDLSVYHKGGIIGLLYRPLTQLPAHWAALIVNGFLGAGAIISLWAFARTVPVSEPLLLRYCSSATLVLGILGCAPMAPVVGTDLPSLFLFIIGINTFLLANTAFLGLTGWVSRIYFLALSGLTFGAAASLRQIYLVIIVFLLPGFVLIFLPYLKRLDHHKGIPHHTFTLIRAPALGTLFVILLAIAVLLTSEQLLLRGSQIRDFAPSVVRSVIAIGHDLSQGQSWCGAWSPETSRLGRQRAFEPLTAFTLERMQNTGLRNLPTLYWCKLRRLLSFAHFGANWTLYAPHDSNDLLAEAVNLPIEMINEAAHRSDVSRSADEIAFLTRLAPVYLGAQEMIGSLLKVAAVATVFGYSVAARWLLNSRACMLVLCASALPFFALLGPHVLLFEIQPRYALPLWILPPLSSWLVYRYLHILSFSR